MHDGQVRALERELAAVDRILAAAAKLVDKQPTLESSESYVKAYTESPAPILAWRIQDLRSRVRLTREALHPEAGE